MTSTTGPVFEISLIGSWHNFDPNDARPDGPNAAVLARLDRSGLHPTPLPPGARLLVAATLLELPDTNSPIQVPIAASVQIHERAGQVAAELTSGGAIVPLRKTSRHKVDWPSDDVSEIEFHQVDYLIPNPDAAAYVTVVFMTPNLTLIDEMEALFDTIVSTAAWVEPAV